MIDREYRFDIIRFVSTILVVVIHISNYYCRYLKNINSSSFVGATIFNSVARISVPLFFMISGALTLGRDIPYKKLCKKVLHFIFVLAVWSLVYIVFDIRYMEYEFTKEQYITLIFNNLKPHLWFMYVIIGLYMISPFARILVVNMTPKQKDAFILLWIVLSGGSKLLRIVLEWFQITDFTTYQVPIVQGTYYLGYFMAGYLIYEKIKGGMKVRKWSFVLAFLLSVAVIILGTLYYSINLKKFYAQFLSYQNLPEIIASLSIFILILSSDIKSLKIQKFFISLSPLLFGVYLMHIIPFDILIKTQPVLETNAFIGVPLYSLSVLGITLLVSFIIHKIPYIKRIIN